MKPSQWVLTQFDWYSYQMRLFGHAATSRKHIIEKRPHEDTGRRHPGPSQRKSFRKNKPKNTAASLILNFWLPGL